MAQTIALVDDDENIRASLSIALEAEGYSVRSFAEGESALSSLVEAPCDLVVLDIKMPRMDGMEVLRRLRQESDMPVIFLTSKDEEIDEVVGLKMGADDYIRKPFSHRLLIERVRAVMRRTEQRAKKPSKESAQDEEEVLKRGDLTLDPLRHFCSWKAEDIVLTVTEFLILHSLVLRPGHVKTRDQLMDAAYEDQVYVDDRTIDSHIKRLRKKFRAADKEFAGIETLYGVGYRYKE